ncbi:MAG: FAD:protein FMN transferase [bacterium]
MQALYRTEQSAHFLGTDMHIVINSSTPEVAVMHCNAAFQESERIEQQYSRFIKGNQLAALNQQVGKWVEVSDELYEFLSYGKKMFEATGGAFDLTVKTLLESWGYDADYTLVENSDHVEKGVIELSPESNVKITAPVDLGGLGKGYALDRMVAQCQEYEHLCINAGGDLFARGKDSGDKPWRILFEHPSDPTQAIGYVDIDDLFLAASSPSRRSWRNRHHLVNPLTQEPANEMLSVYTQGKSGLEADAYATAIFAIGYTKAKTKLEEFPVAAMIVSPTGEISRSSKFQGELFS